MRTPEIFFSFFIFISLAASSQQKEWKIAYVQWKDTVSNESWINVMDPDGGNIKTIIDYPGSDWMPLAEKNQLWFQINKDTAGKKMGLYRYDLKTKKEKYLFDAKGLYQDIGFDKKSELYVGGFSHRPDKNRRSQYDIFLFNEDGTYKKQITNDTAIDLEPVFSPDRNQIVFRSNRDRDPANWGEFEIYIINRDGTGLKRLTYNPDTTKNVSRASNPCWTPGGRIAFSGYWDHTYRIMTMNPDGTDPEPLIRMDDMEQASFDFSPDGKQIVFCGRKKGARNFDIYLVHADGSNLRQLTNDWRRKVQPFFVKLK